MLFGADYPMLGQERLADEWRKEGYVPEVLDGVFSGNVEAFLASIGVAIVGGASQDIGYAAAHMLASEGASVAIWARRNPALENAAARIREETGARVFPVLGDVRKGEDIERVVAATLLSSVASTSQSTTMVRPRSARRWASTMQPGTGRSSRT